MNSEEIQDSGVVTTVDGNYVTVELQRGGGCKSCSMRGFCFSKSSPAVFKIQTELELKIGDRVELMVSAKGRVLASLLIFIVPVFFLFMGFGLASLFVGELSSILFAFAAMALSFFIVRMCDKIWGDKLKIEIARKL